MTMEEETFVLEEDYWKDPAKLRAVLDLIFLFEDPNKETIVS